MSADATSLSLSPEAEARIDDLQGRYPTLEATLLPVLWEIQNHHQWISREWMEYAARRCQIPLSKVLSVVSFYTMFHTEPPGKYHVQVCRNITCHMMGGPELRARIKERLGIEGGGKTEDGRFSLEEVECLAGCSWAPVMAVNGTYHENLTPEKAVLILDELP